MVLLVGLFISGRNAIKRFSRSFGQSWWKSKEVVYYSTFLIICVSLIFTTKWIEIRFSRSFGLSWWKSKGKNKSVMVSLVSFLFLRSSPRLSENSKALHLVFQFVNTIFAEVSVFISW
jgi:hypothetical protein